MKSYCEEIENSQEVARLQRDVSKDPHRDIGILKKEDGINTTNLQESLQPLSETHLRDWISTEAARWGRGK